MECQMFHYLRYDLIGHWRSHMVTFLYKNKLFLDGIKSKLNSHNKYLNKLFATGIVNILNVKYGVNCHLSRGIIHLRDCDFDQTSLMAVPISCWFKNMSTTILRQHVQTHRNYHRIKGLNLIIFINKMIFF